MNEKQQQILKTSGVLILLIGNALLAYAGLPTYNNTDILSEYCKTYLFSKDEFNIPTRECLNELHALHNRLEAKIKEGEQRNADNNPNLYVPKNN